MISIVVLCIGIKLLIISIVVPCTTSIVVLCVGFKWLRISIVVHCIAYDKHISAMHCN